MNKCRAFTTICCFLALVAVYSPNSACGEESRERITYCRPDNMVSAHAYIAEAQGYFEAEGIEVEFQYATNAKICFDSLTAGRSEFTSGGDGPFLFASIQNAPLVVLAFSQKNPELGVFARKDRGVNSIEDLKGKRVGYLPGTVSFFYLARLLEKHGIDFKELQLFPLQPPAMPKALVGGFVDAFVMWEPWGSLALKELGETGIVFRDLTLYRYEGFLTTTKDVTQSRPEIVAKVLRVFLKSEKFLKSNKAESIQILSRAVKLSPELLAALWDGYDQTIAIHPSTIQLLEENFSILLKHDQNFQNKTLPNFESFLAPLFLKKEAPDRVEWSEQENGQK